MLCTRIISPRGLVQPFGFLIWTSAYDVYKISPVFNALLH